MSYKDISSSSNILVYYKTMLFCYLKCRKNAESKNPKVARTKNGRIMPFSKFEEFIIKKSKFTKQQEVSELLTS